MIYFRYSCALVRFLTAPVNRGQDWAGGEGQVLLTDGGSLATHPKEGARWNCHDYQGGNGRYKSRDFVMSSYPSSGGGGAKQRQHWFFNGI